MQGQSLSTDVVSSGGTGTVCQRSGPYRCNSHTDTVVIFRRGDRFPACPMERGHATTWSIVRDPADDR
jgi:hypothetical protein